MKKLAPVSGSESLVYQERWIQLFVHIVKRGRCDVSGKRPSAHLIQDLQQGSFAGSRKTDKRKVRRNCQALDEPGAHDKRRDQNRVVLTNVNTCADKRPNSAQGHSRRSARLSSTRKSHVLEKPLLARNGHEYSIPALDRCRVVHAAILVDGKKGFRRIIRILDRLDQGSVVQFGEIDFLFGQSAFGRSGSGIICRNGIRKARGQN